MVYVKLLPVLGVWAGCFQFLGLFKELRIQGSHRSAEDSKGTLFGANKSTGYGEKCCQDQQWATWALILCGASFYGVQEKEDLSVCTEHIQVKERGCKRRVLCIQVGCKTKLSVNLPFTKVTSQQEFKEILHPLFLILVNTVFCLSF